jgi:hypothetical protein
VGEAGRWNARNLSGGVGLKNDQGEQIVTAYALHRPDGLWSVMLINKDPSGSHDVKIIFRTERAPKGFASSIDIVQFSDAQYQLSADRDQPKPLKSNPPLQFSPGQASAISLPAYSLTVIRGVVR